MDGIMARSNSSNCYFLGAFATGKWLKNFELIMERINGPGRE